jgi:integrase
MREKRPGCWEIRVVVSSRPTVQRSFMVRGDETAADVRRRELVEEFGVNPTMSVAGASMSVGDLLHRFIDAPHLWKSATLVSHRSVTRFLRADVALAELRIVVLTPSAVVAVLARWKRDGVPDPTISARWLVLRSALSWAVAEGLLRRNPLLGMRGPARPEPRLHLSTAQIHALLAAAAELASGARARSVAAPANATWRRDLFVAEQTLLMVRVAADSGARRGELAGLRAGDLDGRVLRIDRAVSGGQIGSTKTKRSRRITLGSTTTAMINAHLAEFPATAAGDWLFATDSSRTMFARPDRLSHRFDRVKSAAGIEEASLHRFRHSVATYLVGKGRITAAQYRLGHGHTGTTLRHYTHAVALEDTDIADDLDGLLNDVAHRPIPAVTDAERMG